jgi:hypothetical protein
LSGARTPNTELKCPECGKTFTHAAALGAHRRIAHGVVGTSANATANRKTTSSRPRNHQCQQRPRRRSTRAAAATTTSVDRDALLRTLFPKGIPPREELIGQLDNWLNEAERRRLPLTTRELPLAQPWRRAELARLVRFRAAGLACCLAGGEADDGASVCAVVSDQPSELPRSACLRRARSSGLCVVSNVFAFPDPGPLRKLTSTVRLPTFASWTPSSGRNAGSTFGSVRLA